MISIVIPVYNAEKTIGLLCRDLMAEIRSRKNLDIILVNDGSTDGSDAICRALQAEHEENITYLRLSRNFGEHNAVMAGLNFARGDYVVIMDDDLQNPPEEVAKLVEEIRKGYDVVYASYLEKMDSRFRNIGSRLHGFLARIFLKKPPDLYLSSFKAINRFLVNEIIKYRGADPYIDAIVLRSTGNIGTVQVRHDPRMHGKSNYTLRKLFTLWGNMMVGYTLIPLRLIGVFGTFLTFLGIALGGLRLIGGLTDFRIDPRDLEKIAPFSVFLRGLDLMALSIVGEYVGRIYLHINREPQYLIREVCTTAHRRRNRDREYREEAV